MPPVYAIMSFLSYRYFRSYTYFSLVQVGALHPFLSEAHLIPFTVYEVRRSLFIIRGTYGYAV